MTKRPNILVIIVDQQKGGCLRLLRRVAGGNTEPRPSCLGWDTIHPGSVPLSPMLTDAGQLDDRAGADQNRHLHPERLPMFGERTVERLDPTLPALPLFRDAGYQTGYIGKWRLDANEPIGNLSARGFDHYFRSNPAVADPVPSVGAAGLYVHKGVDFVTCAHIGPGNLEISPNAMLFGVYIQPISMVPGQRQGGVKIYWSEG